MNSFNISILQCGNVAIASRAAGVLKYGAELKDVLVCSGNAATAVGVTIQATQGTWPGGGGFNPGDLGEE